MVYVSCDGSAWEAFAAQLTHADAEFGRIVDTLARIGGVGCYTLTRGLHSVDPMNMMSAWWFQPHVV